MKYLVALFLALTTFTASAGLPEGTPLFSFTPPTQNTDGSSLDPATELQGYNMYCNGDTSTPVFTVFPSATSYQTTEGELADGNYICELKAQNLEGVESSGSPLASFTVTTPPVATVQPNPPANVIRQ